MHMFMLRKKRQQYRQRNHLLISKRTPCRLSIFIAETSKRFFLPAASACQRGRACRIWSAPGPVDDAAKTTRFLQSSPTPTPKSKSVPKTKRVQECSPNQACTRVFPKTVQSHSKQWCCILVPIDLCNSVAADAPKPYRVVFPYFITYFQ